MIEWLLSEALSSVRRLDEVIDQLTDEQLTQLIELEEAAARRQVFLDKIYRELRQRARKPFVR
jgi:arsenate reductase-like glutaredoxin family protein